MGSWARIPAQRRAQLLAASPKPVPDALALPWGEGLKLRCPLNSAQCWDRGFPKCHPKPNHLHALLRKMFLPGPIPLPRFAALSVVLTGCCGAGLEQGNQQGFK